MPNQDLINKTLESLRANSEFKPDWYKQQNPSKIPTFKSTGLAATVNMGPVKKNVIRDTEFNVRKDQIYDRLSDGSYIAKFENYKGGEGNENRLALEQSGWEQAFNGTAKFVGKVAKNIVGSIGGFVVGAIEGIASGSVSKIWDNDFNDYFDDLDKRMNYGMHNYYSDEEKNNGLLAAIPGFGATNFWFDKVGDGLAFVGGELIPSLAFTLATGGAAAPMLGVSLGKLGLKLGAKKLLKEGIEEGAERLIKGSTKSALKQVDDVANYAVGKESIRDLYRGAITGKSIGDKTTSALFLAKSANFEAGLEARQNFNESIGTFHRDFEEKNGRPPTLNEMEDFSKSAKTAANLVFGTNLGLLAVSNAAMYGKLLNLKLPKIGKQTNNFFNKAIGLGTKTLEDGTMVYNKANKAQKLAGNAYKLLGKPLIEGNEEGMQGVAGKTMQSYLERKYDPNADHTTSMVGDFTNALAKQYGTKEGWAEMGVGMIIGSIAPVIGRNPITGFGKDSRGSAAKGVEEDVAKVNKGIQTMRAMDRANAVQSFTNYKKSTDGDFQSTAAENTMSNVSFIQSQEHIKNTKSITKDFNATIDKYDFSEDELNDFEVAKTTPEEYKEALKSEFKQDIDNYNFAKKAVEAVGLDRVKDTTRGNRETIKDAMIMNIVVGKDSLGAAKNIAGQIQSIITPGTYGQDGLIAPNSGGIFDHLQFYNGLKVEQKQSIEQLKSKKTELKDLQDKNLLYQQELAGLQTRRKRKLNDSTLERNINTVSEKAVVATGQIAKVQKELDTLTEALKSDFGATNFDIDGTVTSNPTNILSTIEELDKLELFQTSLRKSGKNYEADSLDYLMNQFKFHSDSHREMMNAHREMLSTNFFNSKKGTSLLGRLIGQPYKMTDEFRQIIRDNNDKIDSSLGLVGIRGYEKVEDLIQSTLQDNKELSDREKHKLEAMIRIQLNMDAIKKRVDDITSINTEIAAEEEITNDPLEGDTIRLKQKLNLATRNLDNLAEINKVIKEITDQLDSTRNTYNKQKITELETRLEELKAEQQTVVTQTQKPSQQTPKKTEVKRELSFEEKVAKKVEETLSEFLPTKTEEKEDDWAAKGEQPTKEEMKSFAKDLFAKVAWAINNNPGTEADLEGAKKRYRDLSKEVHPDRQNTEEKKEIARQFFQAMVEAKDKGYINVLNRLKESFDKLIKEVDEGVFKDFVEKGEVPQDVIQSIAEKIIRGEKLTVEEQAIRQDKTDEIETRLEELKADQQTVATQTQSTLLDINNISDFSKLTSEQREELKTGMREQVNLLPDDVFFLTHLTLSKDTIDSIIKTGLKTGPAIESTTNTATTKEALIESLEALIDGKINHAGAANLVVLSFPKTLVREGANKTEYVEAIMDYLAENKVEDFGKRLGPEFLAGVFTNGRFSKIDQYNKQTTESTPTQQVDNTAEVQAIEDQIKSLKGVKILESPEIIRLTELLVKDAKEETTTEENEEMEVLKESVDEWMMITGTVVEGIRLSDLIRQKHVLENTPIADIEKVEEVTPDEVNEIIKFEDNKSKVTYEYGQSPDAVTVIKKDGKITVSGISYEDLKAITGDFQYEISEDGKNNIILTEEEVEKINSVGKIGILPTNKDLTTTYNVVVEYTTAIDGTVTGKRLKSPHGKEYSKEMDTEAIYKLKAKDEVVFEIDAVDDYNQFLINQYNEASKSTPEEEEEALEALRVGMVIKVMAGDKFVAVLKARNEPGPRKEEDYKYEAFRDQLINEAISKGVLAGAKAISLKTDTATVSKVMLGHPSFNFVQDANGVNSIEYRRVSEADAGKIVDIGYIVNGKRKSKNSVSTSDTTFIDKFINESKKKKVPFIVVEKNGVKIAYPVKVVPREKQDTKEFEAIFNNMSMSNTDKVVKLNQMLAERGIDIKDPGSAFTSIGKTNLNQEFFDQKLAQLDNIDYFRPLEEWLSTEDNMAEIIKDQILVNIDLSNPFHSPKIKIDFTEIYKNIKLSKEIMDSLKVAKATSRKTKATKSVQSSALMQQGKKC